MSNKYLLGCQHIDDRIRNCEFLGKYIEELRESYGHIRDANMPDLTMTPVKDGINLQLLDHCNELPLTYCKITKLSPYGVYSNVMALFGNHTWYTQDRSGLRCVRVFAESFNLEKDNVNL